jgi:hypothetical protein
MISSIRLILYINVVVNSLYTFLLSTAFGGQISDTIYPLANAARDAGFDDSYCLRHDPERIYLCVFRTHNDKLLESIRDTAVNRLAEIPNFTTSVPQRGFSHEFNGEHYSCSITNILYFRSYRGGHSFSIICMPCTDCK